MKLDISFLAGIFLIGSDLLARAAVQGVEQALVAAAVRAWVQGRDACIDLSKSWREIVFH
jgi:hypothetical protein